jgi:two-component sensor histidine kinase
MFVESTLSFEVERMSRSMCLVEEISHRVMNEYAEAAATLNLAASSTANVQAREVLTSASAQLRARADAHRALGRPSAASPVDLTGYLARICASITKARLAERCIRLTVRGDEVYCGGVQGWLIGLIVAELVRNAERHGLGGGPGEILVEIEKLTDRIACRVSDSGRGVKNVRSGHGTHIVRGLATELGGTASWSSGAGGCSVLIELPVAKPKFNHLEHE